MAESKTSPAGAGCGRGSHGNRDTKEVGEQWGATPCGVDGGKDADREELATESHAPDARLG